MIEEILSHYLPPIEAEMRRVLDLPGDLLTGHYGMLRYHMGWVDPHLQPAQVNSGKRVRPVLVLLACEAAGAPADHALPAAAAVELLHNFSLIHDDIEDDSPTRRHRPTVWALWGRPQAINAGDAMFTLARTALAGLPAAGYRPNRRWRRFTSSTKPVSASPKANTSTCRSRTGWTSRSTST